MSLKLTGSTATCVCWFADGEAVSEEENSGDEENLDALNDDGEAAVTGKRKRRSPKRKTDLSRYAFDWLMWSDKLV